VWTTVEMWTARASIMADHPLCKGEAIVRTTVAAVSLIYACASYPRPDSHRLATARHPEAVRRLVKEGRPG